MEDVGGHRSVGFAIDTGGEELDDPFVSEVLKLLADCASGSEVKGMNVPFDSSRNGFLFKSACVQLG